MIEAELSMVDAAAGADANAAASPKGRFVGTEGRADVAIVVVAYNSGRDLGRLLASLRGEAAAQTLRVVIADNASTDDTLEAARAVDDVIVVESGGNLGYAGGINVAMQHIGETDAILVLNPDLVVEPGCIAALRARLAASGAGVVVPKYLEGDSVFTSLRREPSVLRAIGDSLFGERFAGRPGALSEWVLDRNEYSDVHEVEWATGAALLVDAGVARLVGEWDERFFLYSEETDFFRRVRDLGRSVWYEPAAVVRHERGGSGRSVELDRLVTVNRVRYHRKYHGPLTSGAFRAVAVLHQAARAYSATYRPLLASVVDESSWPTLPRAHRIASAERIRRAHGTVVIDARPSGGPDFAADRHAAVDRTIRALTPFSASPSLHLEVVDARGRRSIGNRVSVSATQSAGERHPLALQDVPTGPVLVIEAGLEPDPATVVETLSVCEVGGAPAGPPLEWSLEGAGPLVRAYAWLRPKALLRSPATGAVYCIAAGEVERSVPPLLARVETNPVRIPVPRSLRRLRRELRCSPGAPSGLMLPSERRDA